MSVVLVTGAGGFVGRAVCRALLARDHRVRAALRRPAAPSALPSGVEPEVVGDIADEPDWTAALEGVDAVVHLAARVHVMHDSAADPLAEFRRVNVRATERLARAAAEAGARRLVFVSSVKVNGEGTLGAPFRESDPPAPADPYGVSKWEGERALRRVEADTGLEVAILRPPLVYGPGVRANFLRLMEAVARGVPLPFGLLDNRRSLVFVENLADAVALAVEHPAAAGESFLVSDGEPLSTAGLVRELARGLGRPPRLVPVPPALLRAAGALTGRPAAIERLCGSLVIDGSKLRGQLGWHPPVTPSDGIVTTTAWYLDRDR